MNDYRVYTYSEKGGYNEFLYSAYTLQDVVNHHIEKVPEEEIIKVEKIAYLER